MTMRTTTGDYTSMLRAVGGAVTKMRKAAGLSQAELAEAAGVHVNTVANIERGSGDPSVVKLSRMLVRLRCPGVVFDSSGFAFLAPLLGIDSVAPDAEPSRIALEIGSRIHDKRLARGLTIKELADKAEIHSNTLWNIENGLVEASCSVAYRVLLSLGSTRVAQGEAGIEIS